MINRRALGNIAALSLLATTFAIYAQQPAKVPRIGFLGMDSGMQATRVAAFRDELGKFGYVDGRTVAIEYRWAEGRFDRLSELAAELAALKVDVLDMMFRRLAYFVDLILKGAKPADLAIDQPKEFEFVVNQKTAQSLGLTLPSSLLLQATEVIR